MMLRAVSLLLLFLFLSSVPSSANKDPDKLKAEFDNALPEGYMAQVVWAQREGDAQCLYAVLSTDGIIFKLTADSMSAGNPQITKDGSKVIFERYGRNEIYVVNWDGSGCRYVADGGGLQDYWHDAANGIDYAVTYQGEIDIATGEMNRTWPGGGGDDGLHISPDGKIVASQWGGWQVWNSETGEFTSRGQGGCVCNVSPDDKYSVMVQQSGHKFEGIETASGDFNTYEVSKDILDKCPVVNDCPGADNGEFQETRWPHPDYITFPIGGLNEGPFLVHLYDETKWVAMQDTLGCALPQEFMCSSVGARIVPTGAIEIKGPAQRSIAARRGTGNRGSEAYLPDGRRLDMSAISKGSTVHGVVIHRIPGESKATRTVLLPQ